MPDISGAAVILPMPTAGNIRLYTYWLYWCLAPGIFHAWRFVYLARRAACLGLFLENLVVTCTAT